MSHPKQVLIGVCGLLFVMAVIRSAIADELYAPPPFDEAHSRTLQWVAGREIADMQVRDQIVAVWSNNDPDRSARLLFEKVIHTFCLGDVETKKFVDACRLVDAPLVPPSLKPLSAKMMNEHYSANINLFYARYLAQRKMYDEALDIFNRLDAKQVVDPATCLYFRAVCQHQLLFRKEGLATLKQLLENTEDVPMRYSSVAALMQYDLEGLRSKSLGEIARKMQDSERRLDLGRGGQRVQKVQVEIIANLDEIIKKIEQQQGGGSGNGLGQNNRNQSSSPANESRIKGNTAPGNVDPKKFRNKNGWGSLPPKAQARAKNIMDRNFPAHYRQAVEQYFKKLAKRRANAGK